MEANRKSRYGWMAVGALLCLVALALLVRLNGGTARARAEEVGPKLPDLAKEKSGNGGAPGMLPLLDGVLPPLPAIEPPLADIVPAKAELPVPPAPPIPPAGLPSPPLPGTEAHPIQIPGAPLIPVAPPVEGKALPPLPSTPPVVTPVPTPVAPLPPIDPKPPEAKPAPLPPVADAPPAPPVTPPLVRVEAKVAVVPYRVLTAGMTVKTLSRQTLGSVERWQEVCRLNPALPVDGTLVVGSTVSLPADAVLTTEDSLQPLPSLRSRPAPRPRAVLPLTGTYAARLDGKGTLVLPEAVLEQLGGCTTVLLSPGSDRCLWLTNQAHLDRLGAKLDKSPAREADVRSFKRLYYAQTVKVPVKERRAFVNDKLTGFAGLSEDVVLVGIDDHFEVWDAATWRRYTQAKKATFATE